MDKGCPPYLVKVINSFLTDRVALLKEGATKRSRNATLGCPQGGVLSPFLWNGLLDPILRIKIPENCKIIAYADDITILVRHRNFNSNDSVAKC